MRSSATQSGVAARRSKATIWVIAGPNGGGKSSIFGEMVRTAGADYFNPDEHTQRLMSRNLDLPREGANMLAWEEGRRRLEYAIASGESFAFETTLGGNTIARLLARAAGRGIAVKIWYVALDSADAHVARVKARVQRGGHDIPEDLVRERYDRSRRNLARLLAKAEAVKVYDNSYEAEVDSGQAPRVRLVLDFAAGRILNKKDVATTPEWAKPIVAAALKAEARVLH